MPRITLEDGMNILHAAFDKARSLNLTVSVSIVDARGDLAYAAARMDNAASSGGGPKAVAARPSPPSPTRVSPAANCWNAPPAPSPRASSKCSTAASCPSRAPCPYSKAAFSSALSAPPAVRARKTKKSPAPAQPL